MWLPDDVKIKDIANESRKTTPVVLFDDVRFGYDEHAVLDHVSFHVEEGEQVTLSGRTGVGKSTLFKLLLGLYEPQEGEVLVGGIPAGQLTEKKDENGLATWSSLITWSRERLEIRLLYTMSRSRKSSRGRIGDPASG